MSGTHIFTLPHFIALRLINFLNIYYIIMPFIVLNKLHTLWISGYQDIFQIIDTYYLFRTCIFTCVDTFNATRACSKLTVQKFAIWMSQNCQKLDFFFKLTKKKSFFQKNENFWQFFQKMSSLWQFLYNSNGNFLDGKVKSLTLLI